MSEKRTLWCVNVRGPDDVLATPDYVTAMRVANRINVFLEAFYRNREWTENDPCTWAIPVEWHGNAESHAESVGSPSAEYAFAFSLAMHDPAFWE